MCAAYYIRDRERERLKGLSGDLERKGRREERRRRRRKMKINVLRTCWRRLEQGRERERDSGGHSPCVTNCCQPSLLWFSAYSKCRFFSFFYLASERVPPFLSVRLADQKLLGQYNKTVATKGLQLLPISVMTAITIPSGYDGPQAKTRRKMETQKTLVLSRSMRPSRSLVSNSMLYCFSSLHFP